MDERSEDRVPGGKAAKPAITREQGTVEVDGEQIRYEIYAVDARSGQHRALDQDRGTPAGNLIVLLPGHGQTVHGSREQVLAAARLSRTKVAWVIDITPAKGGDTAEARALAEIMRLRLDTDFPAMVRTRDAVAQPVTLIGWSHGGGESLRAARHNPGLFQQVVGLCPIGLVKRHPLELIFSFGLEAVHIAWSGLRKLDWAYMRSALRVGTDFIYGLLRDMWRTRSVVRLVEDVLWAGPQVVGPGYDYPGEVVLLLGRRDTVIRWRDAFPGAQQAQDVPALVPAYKQANFPQASRLEVRVLAGNHLAPEVRAAEYVGQALALLGQLDEAYQPDLRP